MTRPTEVVVATANPHKLGELRALLADLPLRLLGLDDLPPGERPGMPEETGATFEENADLKAAHAARATGRHALADDSGFEALGLGSGIPGVRSARFAGADGPRDAVDRANNALLIERARSRGVFDGRAPAAARFRCAVSLAAPDGRILCRGQGSCEGLLVEEARGRGGFGYDPHFLVPELGRTFAELRPEEKNRISHRARALADLRRALLPLIPSLARP